MTKQKGILIALLLAIILFGAILLVMAFRPPQGALPATGEKDAPLPEKSLADRTLESMTLEEKVGQLFFACNYGAAVDPTELETLKPGGYVLFADFFAGKDPDLVKSELDALQAASAHPLLLGVDEEGGTVIRVSKYPAFRETPFASPQELLADGGEERLVQDLQEKSRLLLSLGFNVNLAPVCDITDQPSDFIYSRTFGKSPQETAELTSLYVKTAAQEGIGSVLKHFPGYGSNVDTHTGVAHDPRPLEEFQSKDFLPFLAGIRSGADCILVNHNIIESIDPDHPATLSPKVHALLRRDLGFGGVILTDDMSMDAIAKYSGDANPAVTAIRAGNDLICTGDYASQIPAVLDAVTSGTLSETQIDTAAGRVLQWKESLGLLSEPTK